MSFENNFNITERKRVEQGYLEEYKPINNRKGQKLEFKGIVKRDTGNLSQLIT